MNSASFVTKELINWKAMGFTRPELAVKLAEACLGWPYVWGGAGQYCTAANRRSYADRATCPAAEAAVIRKKCRRLSGGADSCAGCGYWPGSSTRFFDCRGFTRWVLQQACGWTLQGAGATSQWNTDSNWAEKGTIADLPAGKVCCVFKCSGKTMEHTGLHIGNGIILHCSGEVKRGKTADRGWTHYAVPVCLKDQGNDGTVPSRCGEAETEGLSQGVSRPMLRSGSRGDAVKEMQEKLLARGYDLGKCGADGIFGRMTFIAVRAFQRAAGLKADGICGPLTWTELLKED